MKDYNIRDGDVICIKAYTVRNFGNKYFLCVSRDLTGTKVVSGFDGNVYPFPTDKIDYIRIDGYWWKVLMINDDKDDIKKYGEITYHISQTDARVNGYLDDLFYDSLDYPD